MRPWARLRDDRCCSLPRGVEARGCDTFSPPRLGKNVIREVLVSEKAHQTGNERVTTRPVLVTGATGRVGRAVITEFQGAGVPVRALTRNPAMAALPATVEVVAGDFTEPDSL